MELFTARPELSGTFGAVASTHWIASSVGMKLLEAGGNAFDAAAAAGFVLQVVEPHLNGAGGDAPILVAPAGSQQPAVICGQGPAPASASIARFHELSLDLIPGTGLLAACVPGAYGAWLTMLRDHGSVHLREVLEPAIHYAREGHPLLERASDTIGSVRSLFIEHWPSSAEVYLDNGEVPQPGRLFRNPGLARLYETILEHSEATSPDRIGQIEAALAYWYEGPVAEAIDRYCGETEAMDVSGRKHRGLLTAEDLNGWRPPIEDAVSVPFAGHEVFKCGPWSQGPALLQALRILEGADLAALDPESPEHVHLLTETLKLVMADRDAWYGDTPDTPLEHLLSAGYGNERAALIGEMASQEIRPGLINGVQGRVPFIRPRGSTVMTGPGGGEPTMARERSETDPRNRNPLQVGDTCHVDVVDRWGNMVSATPSGGWLQSSPVIPELGFALGTRLQMFWLEDGFANSLAPRKRPRTTLTPTMVYRDGRPYLACGTPGGDQQEQWTLQLLLSHIVHGRGLQRSIETPAFHSDHMIASFWPRECALGALTVESRFPPETIRELERRGHKLKVGGPWSEGRLSACAIDRKGGETLLRAAANPRGMQGYAIAR